MDVQVSKLRENFKGTHYLIKTSDNKILFLRAWEPSTKIDVAILIFHGITAHSGPYEMIAKPLSILGYSIFGLDLRGHGLSDGIRGDYPSKKRLISDLSETIDFLKQSFSKIILLGHSLGVLTAALASIHFSEDIDGLILLSAGREVKPDVYAPISTKTKLKILFNAIISPSKPVITYYRDGMTGRDDPLYNFKYTLRFIKIFNAKKFKIPGKLNMPVILGIGDQDEIFTVESAKDLYNELPSDDKEFIVMEGATHADIPPESFKPVISWLDKNFK